MNSDIAERYIGCCGAYCKTCKVFIEGVCKGCKLGYIEGKRDIGKAKCIMKICCFKEKKMETCADCPKCPDCNIIHNFYSKRGFKYKKYKQAIEFIKKNGYSKFVKLADEWNGPYGKLE
ncbi:MAG: DUF3795 domain-containing protein [Candidatus Micrarchaeota archaeon]